MKATFLTIAAVLTSGAFTIGLAPSTLAGDGSGKKPVGTSKQTEASGIDAPKLWAQTCTRCHSTRPATSFSDAQWEVILRHMRVRANLTGPEARAITEFLKDAN
jgi:hypothetical protein